MWMASWRDVNGNVRHDLLYKTETNNQGEYGSLLFVLNHIITIAGFEPWLEDVTIYGDSQLVIYQMLGKYKVKEENLKPLWLEAINLVHILKVSHNIIVTFGWIPRELNNEALGLETKLETEV